MSDVDDETKTVLDALSVKLDKIGDTLAEFAAAQRVGQLENRTALIEVRASIAELRVSITELRTNRGDGHQENPA